MLNDVIAIAKHAGIAIKANYLNTEHVSISTKADHSPVTQADLLSHRLISYGLSELSEKLPVISEEGRGTPWEERQTYSRYWLIDPLDGTQEFIHRTDDFAVNIALIDGDEAVLGVVYVPMFNAVYYAEKGKGAFKHVEGDDPFPIKCSPFVKDGTLRVVASRRHEGKRLHSVLEQIPEHTVIRRGSTLKICVVAEGEADLYPRLGPTSEWDTAAAQIIIEEAGGHITDLEGQRLRYNQKDSLINPFFVATSASWQQLSPYLPYFQPFIEASKNCG